MKKCCSCHILKPLEDFGIDKVNKDGHLYIRGLLCHMCNVGLGIFLDDAELLIKAACYLKQYDQEIKCV